MDQHESSRRQFLSSVLVASSGALLSETSFAADESTKPAASTTQPVRSIEEGRLTFHGIDTHHGATIGTLSVELSYFEGGAFRLIKHFDTVKNGRSDGALLQGAAFKPGLYEALLYVDDYFSALKTPLPTPNFLKKSTPSSDGIFLYSA